MSVMLILSSFVTTLLIAPADYQGSGKAGGRAIAFLAHRYLGPAFGTIYDLSTILILGLAGASAMAGLLHLIPRYLPRFGMAPRWAALSRPLVLVLFAIDVVITLIFDADVESQSGAYATGVLVLILSAALAATLALWRERRKGLATYTGIIFLVFAYTLVDNCVGRPDGLIIGGVFTLLLMLASGLSRSIRSVEFRIPEGFFTDIESWRLGPEVRGKKVHMVPIASSSAEARRKKRAEIARHYGVRGPFLFVHVNLLDNRSEFSSPLEVTLQGGRRLYRGGLWCHRYRQHHRLHQRGHRPHFNLHRTHPTGTHIAGGSLSPVRRGRDRTHGLHDPPAVLGLDPGGGRPAAHLPDERLTATYIFRGENDGTRTNLDRRSPEDATCGGDCRYRVFDFVHHQRGARSGFPSLPARRMQERGFPGAGGPSVSHFTCCPSQALPFSGSLPCCGTGWEHTKTVSLTRFSSAAGSCFLPCCSSPPRWRGVS